MQGVGLWAALLRTRFDRAVAASGIRQDWEKLRTDLFDPPQGAQLRLL